jgi:CTP:molybdopterin cytidylyltransferase MocA
VAGNPVLFGRRHFPALRALSGDTGAKAVITANLASVFDLPVTDESVLVDLDTPEAWSAWRAGRQP